MYHIAQFSIFLNRQKVRNQLFRQRKSVNDCTLRTCGLRNNACVLHTHFIKVILVLIVMLLAPVVIEAGFRREARVDWTVEYPSIPPSSGLRVRACAVTSLR